MTTWLTDIRKTALIAGITCVLSLAVPVYEGPPKLAALDAKTVAWWVFPSTALGLIVTLIIPVFDFVLYLDKGALAPSRRLRALSLAGAFALGVVMVMTIPEWVRLFGTGTDASVLTSGRGPWTLAQLSTLLSALSNGGAILLLIALANFPEEESNASVPVSKLLRVVATMAAITWGLCTSLGVLRLLLTPYTYVQMRALAIQLGRTPVGLPYLISDAARGLLGLFGLFVAPFVVWRSISAARPPATNDPQD